MPIQQKLKNHSIGGFWAVKGVQDSTRKIPFWSKSEQEPSLSTILNFRIAEKKLFQEKANNKFVRIEERSFKLRSGQRQTTLRMGRLIGQSNFTQCHIEYQSFSEQIKPRSGYCF